MIKKTFITLFFLVFGVLIIVVSTANYYQNKNITDLLSQKLDGRLIPHHNNYKNILNNVLSDNLHSFEFDTIFNSKSNTPYFEIGHDKKDLKGTSFADYLEITKDRKIIKMWMDIKNVDENNIVYILKRLNYLDKKYSIKNILIFETSSRSPMVKLISDAGYHTSYYLSLPDRNAAYQKAEAKKIQKQIESQNLKAISFPTHLYPFVKKYVEAGISKDIVFHTWGTYRFRKKGELLKIQKEDFYADDRIKTIIYTYYNNKLNRLYDF